MATPKKSKASKAETAAPDPKVHEGEIWHKPFSYKTKAGVTIKVEGHWERKPGSGLKPKVAKPAGGKASGVRGTQGRSASTKKTKEATGDAAAPSTPEAEADA